MAVAILTNQAKAFWSTGHLIVARMAEQLLSEKSPEAFAKALEELSQLKLSHPDIITNENEHSFTECATYADDIKLTYGAF